MNIIITGANGFIARNISRNLGNKSNITLLTHSKINFFFLKKFKTYQFNLKKNIVPELKCDILIHAAGITPQKNYNSKEYKKINYESIKIILKKIKIRKKIIFLSTTDVYKNQNKKIAKESDQINLSKISHYAKSKYNSELYLKKLDRNNFPFKKIILRLPGIIGKGNHNNFISKILINISKNKKITYYDNQNFFNNVYHISHLVDLIRKLIYNKNIDNYEVINVATINPIKIKDIFTLIKKKDFLLIEKNNVKDNKEMFTIKINKLKKYYKMIDTKKLLKKYFNA